MTPLIYAFIAIGGALGSVARAWLNTLALRQFGGHFPYGTIAINILGSALIGIFAASALATSRSLISTEVRIFLMVGVCGGFTTFSSFSLQTFDLLREGRAVAAFANIGLSVVLCVLASAAGYLGTAALVAR
jgi:fluoride exporter